MGVGIEEGEIVQSTEYSTEPRRLDRASKRRACGERPGVVLAPLLVCCRVLTALVMQLVCKSKPGLEGTRTDFMVHR